MEYSYYQRLKMAANAAISTWRDPGSVDRSASLSELADIYSRRWAYFRDNSRAVYSSAYLQGCRAAGIALYDYTRLLFNPVPTIVAFYEDHLFPGVHEEVKDDKGVVVAHLATPLAEGADSNLKLAIAQIDQWSNWLSECARFVRFGAATGSVGAEVLDLLDSERVSHRILWPSHVAEVTLDSAGNVKYYALEYKAYDKERKEHYTFRKEVDGGEFRYFRGDKPFDPPERTEGDAGKISTGVYANPYGFVPFVWAKHSDDGDERGLPAVLNLDKVDEVNSLASHGHDHAHKSIEKPKVVSTDGTIMAVTGAAGESRRGESGGISFTGYDSRFDWPLLKTGADGKVGDLGSDFDLASLDPQIDRILKSFQTDYPELQAAEIIQNKAELSGAALERMLAPSQSKLDKAFAVYGQQVIKLKQMSVAIAGWRTKNGWTKRDAQRTVFAGFDLNSYSQGKLNFGLRRPLLVQSTPMEEEELKAKKAERATTLGAMVDELEALKVAGYSEEEAKSIISRKGGANDSGEGQQ